MVLSLNCNHFWNSNMDKLENYQLKKLHVLQNKFLKLIKNVPIRFRTDLEHIETKMKKNYEHIF